MFINKICIILYSVNLYDIWLPILAIAGFNECGSDKDCPPAKPYCIYISEILVSGGFCSSKNVSIKFQNDEMFATCIRLC